jgi:ribosomal protein L37AE/L43A
MPLTRAKCPNCGSVDIDIIKEKIIVCRKCKEFH